MTVPLIWRDRFVTIEEGNAVFSKKGRWHNFNFSPPKYQPKTMACALNPGGKVIDIEVIDDDHLRLVAMNGTFVLTGDDWDTAAISPESHGGAV